MKRHTLLNISNSVTAALFLLGTTLFGTACSKSNGPTPNNNGNNGPNNNTNTGNKTTAIKYTNSAPTPINIYGYGGTAVIPVGGSITFTGTSGTTFTASANAYATMTSAMLSGTSTLGSQIGDKVSWSISNTFPTSDTLRQELYVDASVFYLRVRNTSSTKVKSLRINSDLGSQYRFLASDLVIPNNGETYDLGYFPASVNSTVYLFESAYGSASAGGLKWYLTCSLPMSNNQTYLAIVN